LEHQVLSSRNIFPSPAIDFLYGGLNYQIEHHLFPTIPRNNLPEARRVVKQFCAERGLAYQETGMIASYVEVLAYFHRMSEPLRSRRALEAFMARRERAAEVVADA
jgi:fatty acid desaturase